MGGVDLSFGPCTDPSVTIGPRPCGRGGFKLPILVHLRRHSCPRPCGRGGFKLQHSDVCRVELGPRPCGRGGFKQECPDVIVKEGRVPARVGGVDLSNRSVYDRVLALRPRPCGRGGFKL